MSAKRKVTIVGAGAVGSTYAYALAQKGIADEIAIIDMNRDLVKGQMLDLAHGLPYYPTVQFKVGSVDDYAGSQVIVITAGSAQKPGESRIDLLKKNVRIVESIMDDIVAQKSEAVVVVVSNPADVLAWFAAKRAAWPQGRVISSGTVLDSARLRYMISQTCKVDVSNVHAYVIGEHGDSQLAAWSLSHIGGISIDQYCPMCAKCEDGLEERKKIEEDVKNSAYHIIDYKGATFYAVGLALVRITEAILKDQRSVLTVSTLLQGEYGLSDVMISVPCLLGRKGVEEIIIGRLSEDEHDRLQLSAGVIREAIASIESQ